MVTSARQPWEKQRQQLYQAQQLYPRALFQGHPKVIIATIRTFVIVATVQAKVSVATIYSNHV
jgi:hypothetical protein